MQKKTCPDWLSKTYRLAYSSRTIMLTLKIVDALAVVFSAAVLALSLYRAFLGSLNELIWLLLFLSTTFVMVSGLRLMIGAERPYQVFDFSEFSAVAPKNKQGLSFPSRHVFSAFIISVVACKYAPVLGGFGILLSVLMAASRVMLGKHFLKDVVCGALIGIASALVIILIL